MTRRPFTITITTRWVSPPPPHDYPYYWVILDAKSKENDVKVINLKNLPKLQWFYFLNNHYTRHFVKLLDKMCKYEMDPTSIVEDTERTRPCPQTDRRTRWNQYTPFQVRWSGGIINQTLVHFRLTHANQILLLKCIPQRFPYWTSQTSMHVGGLRAYITTHACMFIESLGFLRQDDSSIIYDFWIQGAGVSFNVWLNKFHVLTFLKW